MFCADIYREWAGVGEPVSSPATLLGGAGTHLSGEAPLPAAPTLVSVLGHILTLVLFRDELVRVKSVCLLQVRDRCCSVPMGA